MSTERRGVGGKGRSGRDAGPAGFGATAIASPPSRQRTPRPQPVAWARDPCAPRIVRVRATPGGAVVVPGTRRGRGAAMRKRAAAERNRVEGGRARPHTPPRAPSTCARPRVHRAECVRVCSGHETHLSTHFSRVSVGAKPVKKGNESEEVPHFRSKRRRLPKGHRANRRSRRPPCACILTRHTLVFTLALPLPPRDTKTMASRRSPSSHAPSLALSTACQAGSGDLFDRLAAGLNTLVPLVPTKGARLASTLPPRGAVRALLAATPGAGTPASTTDAVDWLLAGAVAEAADLGADDAAGDLPRSAARAAALAAVRPPPRGGGARRLLRSLLRLEGKKKIPSPDDDEEEAVSPPSLDSALSRALRRAAKADAKSARAADGDRAAMLAAYEDDIRAFAEKQAAEAGGGVKKQKKKKGGWGGNGASLFGASDDGDDDTFAQQARSDDEGDATTPSDDEWSATVAADADFDALVDAGDDAGAARSERDAAAAALTTAVETRERDLRTKSYFERGAEEARRRAEDKLLGPDPEENGDPTPATVTTRAEDAAAAPTVPTDVRLPTAAKLAAADTAAARRGLGKEVGRPSEGARDGVAGASLVARGLWARTPPRRVASFMGSLLPARLPQPDVAFGLYASARDAADALAPWAGRDGAETAADPLFGSAVVAAAARARLSLLAYIPHDLPAADLAAGLSNAMTDGAAAAAAAAFAADVASLKAALCVGALPPLPSRADVEHLDWPCLAAAAEVATAGRALAANLAAAAARAAAGGGEGWVTAAGVIPRGTRFRAAAAPGDTVVVEAFPPAPGGARTRAMLVARGPEGSATALFGAVVGAGAADPVASRSAAAWFAFAVNAALPGARAWLPGFNPAKHGALEVLSAAAARFRLGGGVPALVGRKAAAE